MQPLLQRPPQREHGIGEIGVGDRTVRHCRAGAADRRHVAIGDEVRMRQHRAPAEEAEAAERRRIGLAIALERMPMRPVALRAMRLHMRAGLLRQRAEPGQRRIGATGDEARRDHRQHAAIGIVRMAADIVDEGARIGQRRFRTRVAIIVRTARPIVHHHLADQRALTVGEREVGEKLGGVEIDRGEVERRRRAIGEQVAYQRVVARPGESGIGIARFEREGVFAQPDFERLVQRLAQLRILRRMHMQIDKAGQQHGAAGIDRLTRRGVIAGRAGPQHGVDAAGRVDHHDRIGQHLDLARHRCVEPRSTDRPPRTSPSLTPRPPCGFRRSAR